MNPKKFGSLANHNQEPWQRPLPRFIEHLYLKHFVDTATIRSHQRQGDFTVHTSPSAVYVDEPDLYHGRLVCNFPQNYFRNGGP